MKVYKIPFYADKSEPYQALMLRLSKKHLGGDFARSLDDLKAILSDEGSYEARGYCSMSAPSALKPELRQTVEGLVEKSREKCKPVYDEMVSALKSMPQSEVIGMCSSLELCSKIFADRPPVKILVWENINKGGVSSITEIKL